MLTKELGENLFLVNLENRGFKNLIASYILRSAKTVIVESGPTSSVITLLSSLKELGIEVQDVAYVALTHVHLDHGGGTGNLLKVLPNAKVIVHPRGAPHLLNPRKLWLQSKKVLGQVAEIYGAPKPVPENRIILADEGETFSAGNNVQLKVVETLGHAAHNLSYYELVNKGLFTGDAAGIYLSEFDVVVPTTPPPFRLDMALASLEKLANLNPKFLFYSHFGKVTDAVKRLRNYALQLKLWSGIIKESLRNGKDMEGILERILVEDPAMCKITPFLETHPLFMKTAVENSVQGFIDFTRKSNT